MSRRTRIVATLGPATDRPGVLAKLLQAGLNVARINFSHGEAAEHLERIARLREAASQLDRPIAVLADLPGPKLRVILDQPIQLEPGQHVTIGRRSGASADLQLTEPEAMQEVKAGHRVLLDDGRLQARVDSADADRVTMIVEQGGELLPNKGVNLPDSDLALPAVTDRDREALAVAAQAGVDWLALSFVRDAKAANELRQVAGEYGIHVPILAKMERPEAVARAEEIVRAFDGIMVARGDLGVEIALEKVPHVQKRLITLARIAGRPVITATDMLDSMRSNSRPTRAEASDVANAVYDGTDAVMLSGETAVGEYPVIALACMDRILREAELHNDDDAPRQLFVPLADLNDHLSHATWTLAHSIGARAIITPTRSGRAARLIARHRPALPIIAPTEHETVRRQLALVWGLRPLLMPALSPGEDRLEAAVHCAVRAGLLENDCRVVVLTGSPIEGGRPDPTIRVVHITAERLASAKND